MKSTWDVKKFGLVCNLKKGKNPALISIWKDGFKPYLSAKYIRGKGMAEYASILDKKSVLVTPHEIIIICDGSNSGETFIGHDGILSSTMAKVVHTENIDNKFLTYFLSTLEEKFKSGKTGSAIPHLDLNALKEEKLPLPSPLEQKRIVAILDKAFENIVIAKANAEQNLKNARELFESYLQSIFTQKGDGWKLKTLEEISTVFGRGKSRHRPRGDEKLLGGKYPVIQTSEIGNSNHYITEYTQTYNEMGLAQSKLWPKGTICIAIVGANVAETAILGFESCFPDSVIGIVVNEKLASNEYVEFLLQSFKAILKERGKGTARDNINMGTFENQKFPFPDVPEQKRIVSKINNIAKETQHLESIYQQKIAALDELKKSLLHKAFSGEL